MCLNCFQTPCHAPAFTWRTWHNVQKVFNIIPQEHLPYCRPGPCTLCALQPSLSDAQAQVYTLPATLKTKLKHSIVCAHSTHLQHCLASNEPECILPMAWMPDEHTFLEGLCCLVLWIQGCTDLQSTAVWYVSMSIDHVYRSCPPVQRVDDSSKDLKYASVLKLSSEQTTTQR